jgi:hypothetical protein
MLSRALFNYSKHLSPGEANQLLDSQKITHITWNLRANYSILTCPKAVSILIQPFPVHTLHPTCPSPEPARSSPHPTSHLSLS